MLSKNKSAFVISVVLAVLVAFIPCAGRAASPLQNISARAYCVAERDTGRVLLSHNADERLPMASTTKVMTALVAIENCDLEEVVEIPPEACGIEGSSIYLEAGEHMTVYELVCGLMLHSGNDAAVAIALHTAGSVAEFCGMMNEMATELGATDTSFVNPNGLPADGHYTTAKDLAIISAAAMRNETFANIVGTRQATIPKEGYTWDRALTNKNKLLYSYEGANGIKTGFTKAAGRCLVGGAERGGMQLVTVVLNAPDMYNDTISLLDAAYSEYSMVTVLEKNAVVGEAAVKNGVLRALELRVKDGIVLPLTQEEKQRVTVGIDAVELLEAPVEVGDAAGTARAYLSGEPVAQSELISGEASKEATVGYYFTKLAFGWLGA